MLILQYRIKKITTQDLSVFQNTKDYPMPIIVDGKIEPAFTITYNDSEFGITVVKFVFL